MPAAETLAEAPVAFSFLSRLNCDGDRGGDCGRKATRVGLRRPFAATFALLPATAAAAAGVNLGAPMGCACCPGGRPLHGSTRALPMPALAAASAASSWLSAVETTQAAGVVVVTPRATAAASIARRRLMASDFAPSMPRRAGGKSSGGSALPSAATVPAIGCAIQQ